MLEQLAVSERHRAWVDQVAQLFGGLDICAIELLVGKDGREYIIEVNDSALSLMGDSQEEDRRHIADLVTAKMQVGEKRNKYILLSLSLKTNSNIKLGYLFLIFKLSIFSSFFLVSLKKKPIVEMDIQAFCRPPSVLTKTTSRGSMSGSSQATSPVEDRAPPPTTAPLGSHGSMGSMASIGSLGSVGSMTAVAGDVTTSDSHHQLQRRDSQGFVIVYNLLLINS